MAAASLVILETGANARRAMSQPPAAAPASATGPATRSSTKRWWTEPFTSSSDVPTTITSPGWLAPSGEASNRNGS